MSDILVVGSDREYTPYLLEALAADQLAVSLDMPNRIRKFNDGNDKRTNYIVAQRHMESHADSVDMVLVLDHHNVESYVNGFIATVRSSAKPDIPIISCSALSLHEQWAILSKGGDIRPSAVYGFEKLLIDVNRRAHDMALILNKYTNGNGDLALVIGDKRSRVPINDQVRKTHTFLEVIAKSDRLARAGSQYMMDVPGTMPVLFDVTENSATLKLPTLDLLSSATYAHATVFANFNSKLIDSSAATR